MVDFEWRSFTVAIACEFLPCWQTRPGIKLIRIKLNSVLVRPLQILYWVSNIDLAVLKEKKIAQRSMEQIFWMVSSNYNMHHFLRKKKQWRGDHWHAEQDIRPDVLTPTHLNMSDFRFYLSWSCLLSAAAGQIESWCGQAHVRLQSQHRCIEHRRIVTVPNYSKATVKILTTCLSSRFTKECSMGGSFGRKEECCSAHKLGSGAQYGSALVLRLFKVNLLIKICSWYSGW